MEMTAEQNLIDGGGWYAAVEGPAADNPSRGHRAAPQEDRASLRYAPVIAWERYTDEDGNPQLRAWLSGQKPFPSDKFSEECATHFINHFTPGNRRGRGPSFGPNPGINRPSSPCGAPRPKTCENRALSCLYT